MIKKFLPAEMKLRLRVLHRNAKDLVSGQQTRFVSRKAKEISFKTQLKLSQPIRKNAYSDNKIQNLKLGASFIENKKIEPGQVLSFWHLIPRPVAKNGFKKGRNLIGNGLSADYGGGLCQLSGVLYHMGLLAGMEVIERHPHSLDIYTEDSRYTPLGSDATVVFGHKDLRLKNNYDFPVCFRFDILADEIWVHFCALKPVRHHQIKFERTDQDNYNYAKVSRMRKGEWEIISEDEYGRIGS